MTCIEKLRELNPWVTDSNVPECIKSYCPSEFGIMANTKGCYAEYEECVACWSREVPDKPIVSIHTNDKSHCRQDSYDSDEWRYVRIRYGGERIKPILSRGQMLRRLAESWGAPESWVLDQAVKLLYERCEGVEAELDDGIA